MKIIFILLLIIKNIDTFIININYPHCIKCINYDNYNKNGISSLVKCTQFGIRNLITGRIKYDLAIDCRNDCNKCGNIGKFYKSIKKDTL